MKFVPLPLFTESRAAAEKPKGWPFLRLGFRPFYICGALAAALLVPLWVAIFLGVLPWQTAVPGLLWHAHEMLYGFAMAIVVGFLMTAGKTWTGLATPRGPLLGALALLWLAARLAGMGGATWLYALLDVLLLPVIAVIFATLLLRSKNYRNLPLAMILLLLATANGVFHLAVNGWLDVAPMRPLHAALALITLIECVIAGRVIPAFTMAANPGLKLVASPWVERLALGLTAVGLLLWVFLPDGWLAAIVLVAAAVAQLWRFLGWRSKLALCKPVVWILHFAYAWIPLALLMLALAQVGLLSVSVGVHALGLGATGGLIIGMITRTARGHTGRSLVISWVEVLTYVLVMVAAFSRLLAMLLPPVYYAAFLVLAAITWSLAFLIYLWKYTPWLLQTRLDGKDG
ncbi:MAG: NnrS family protein [Rhodoferax sp.]|nr:NnrS family protein [Rhodoferax sp.]